MMPKIVSTSLSYERCWGLTLALSPEDAGRLTFAIRLNNGRVCPPVVGAADPQGALSYTWILLPEDFGQEGRFIATAAWEVDPAEVPELIAKIFGGEVGAPDHARVSADAHHEFPQVQELGGPWEEQGCWFVGIPTSVLGPLATGTRSFTVAGIPYVKEWEPE